MRIRRIRWTTLSAAAAVLAVGLVSTSAHPASAIKYSGEYSATKAACRAAVKAYQADGWKILQNCPYIKNFGYLVDASRD